MAVAPASVSLFKAYCERERCPFAIVGVADGSGNLTVADARFNNKPVDMSLDVLLGKPPRMERVAARKSQQSADAQTSVKMKLRDAAYRVLQHPAVADKTFLITIGDRFVGGLTAREQMVGPW